MLKWYGLNRSIVTKVILVLLVGGVLLLLSSPEPEQPEVSEPEPDPYPEIKLFYGLDEVDSGTARLPSTFVGETAEAFFIVKNAGTADLRVTDISLSGRQASDFTVSRPRRPIPPSKGKLLQVYFTPQSPGTSNALLSITTNDENNPEITIQLSGSCEPIEKPDKLVAIPESGEVSLKWNPVNGAESYNLYWGLDPELQNSTQVSSVSNPFVVGNLTDGVLHYFSVTAVSQHGESEASDTIWAHPGTTVYLDSQNGDDANNGSSRELAWKSLERVKAHAFQPGDNFLLKRGGFWTGMLEIAENGTSTHPITISAYGEGVDPIINNRGPVPGWDDESMWTSHGDNIWSIYYGPWKNAYRLWLDGEEAVKAQFIGNLSEAYPWKWDFDEEHIFLYSQLNPANGFTSIEESGAYSGTSLNVRNVNYHSYRSLRLEGGGSAVSLTGSNHVEFIKCEIGRYTGGIGMWVSGMYNENGVKPSDYGLIKWCLVDPWFRQTYPFEKAQTEDGIHMRDNVNHWTITDSVIRDWGHTGIDIFQTRNDTTVNYNTIKDNFFTSAHVSYGRAFSTKGRPGGCSYNLFEGNIIANCSVQIQIGSDHNQIVGNIIYGQWTSDAIRYSEGQSIVLNPAMSGNPVYVSTNNLLANNVIYDSTGTGIDSQQYAGDNITGNTIRDNLFILTGHKQHSEFIGIGVKIGNYVEPGTPITYEGIRVLNNIVLNPGVNANYWYRGDAMNSTTFNEFDNPYGDVIRGNTEIMVSEMEIVLTEKMLLSLLN